MFQFFLICLLLMMETLRVFSKLDNIVVRRLASPFSARENHWWCSVWQIPRDFFKLFLNRFFGVPLSRSPAESSLHSYDPGQTILTILETYPVQCCLNFSNLDAGDLRLFKDFNIGDEVTPVEAEDGDEATLMEPFEKS